MVERLLYTEDVGGSSPSSPTNLRAFRRFGGQASLSRERCPPSPEGLMYGILQVKEKIDRDRKALKRSPKNRPAGTPKNAA